MTGQAKTIRFGDFVLEIPVRQLRRCGEEIVLQPKVFDTLVFLARNADRVVSKDELLDKIWAGTVVTENALARVISALRKALDDKKSPAQYIRAVPRVGYQFIAPVLQQGGDDNDRALAVLPFRHLSDPDAEGRLGLGIAEALVSRLSRLPDLVVRPLSSASEAWNRLGEPIKVARYIQASEYLEGSVQQSRDGVRVSAHLISTSNETPYWSEIVDVPAGDIFAVQDAICEKIVAALAPQLNLSGPETPVTNSDAYSAYLEGRFFVGRATPADAQRASERFEAALDIDPAYGPAWAGIAECHDYLGTMGVDPAKHFQAARRAATRALALHPGLANATNVLGRVAWQYDWDWVRAEEIFEEGISLHPGNAELRIAYSDYCCFVNKSARGIEQAEHALRIDPVSPWVNTLLAQAYYMAGENSLASRQIRRTFEFDADFAFAHFFSGLISLACGDADTAIESLQRAVESGRPDFVGAYGMCLGLAGRIGEAEKVLESILAQGDAAPAIARATAYLGLQRYDEAAAEFSQCVADRDWHILLLYSDPLFADAATQPQLARILRQLNLPSGETGSPADKSGRP